MLALILIAVLIAGVRLGGEHGAAFKTIAHLFTFGLLGAWVVTGLRTGWRYFAIAAALSVVELAAFLKIV